MGAMIAESAFWQSKAVELGGQVEALNSKLNLQRKQARAILQDANASRSQREAAQRRLDDANLKILELSDIVARKDLEISAYIHVIRNDAPQLLSHGDHRITDALNRYIAGDYKAADGLPGLIDLEAAAVDAAWSAAHKKKQAAKHRFVAVIFSDEREKGRKTTKAVLDQWQKAAELDPDEFWQWITIANLARDLDDDSLKQQAASKAGSLVQTAGERAAVLNLYSFLGGLGQAPAHLLKGQSAEEAELQIYLDQVKENPNDPDGIYRVADQILNMAAGKVINYRINLESFAVMKPAAETLDEVSSLLVRAELAIQSSEKLSGGKLNVLGLWRRYWRAKGDLAGVRGDWEGERVGHENALKIAREQYAVDPENIVLLSILQDSEQALARSAGDAERRLSLLNESVMIAKRNYESDPDKRLFSFSLWSSETDLGLLAHRMGKYQIAEEAFEVALQVGRKYDAAGKTPFMEYLTLPRLAQAKMSLGKTDEARLIINQAIDSYQAGLSDSGSAPISKEVQLLKIDLADLDSIEGNHGESIIILNDMYNIISAAPERAEMKLEDVYELRFQILDRIASELLFLGDMEAYVGNRLRTIDLLKGLKGKDLDSLEADFQIGTIFGVLADFPGGHANWTEVRKQFASLATKPGLSDQLKASIPVILRIAEIREKDAPAMSEGEIVPRMRRSLQIAYDYYQMSSSPAAEAATAGHLLFLAQIPNSGITFTQALGFMQSMPIFRPDGDIWQYRVDMMAGRLAWAAKKTNAHEAMPSKDGHGSNGLFRR